MVPILDGLLLTLGTSLLQEESESSVASRNIITVIAYFIHRVKNGLPGWCEQLTGRHKLISAYLSGAGGMLQKDGKLNRPNWNLTHTTKQGSRVS